MNQKDILVFLSDQHSGRITGYSGNTIIRTPNLDSLALNGTVFTSAYTSCPLCVPARMSMLSGRLPSKTGVFENEGSISSDQATFLHSLGAVGYDVVLCGRMHFEGPDQRHGFTKRIFGDITPPYTHNKKAMMERKHFARTLSENGCLDLIGGGNSPTLEYDRKVIQAAVEYLDVEHEKPQCIVVGTYAPHFPYVAPPELFNYYKDMVEVPGTLSLGCNYEHPVDSCRLRNTDEETVLVARTAYYGMVEFVDQCIGRVQKAWEKYLSRSGREGLFIYLSDHGDQVGERGFYGKKTFYESSAGIPLLFYGSGIKKGRRINNPVSIMDLGPTLCDLAEAPYPPEQEGKSLLEQIAGGGEDGQRAVISEFVDTDENGNKVPGRMIRKGRWKYITYHGFDDHDLLFDIESDPDELNNLSKRNEAVSKELKNLCIKEWDPEAIMEAYHKRAEHIKLIRLWSSNIDEFEIDERWRTNKEALEMPAPVYSAELYRKKDQI